MPRHMVWLAAVVFMLAVGCGMDGGDMNRNSGEDSSVSPEQITELENGLRSKPSAEAAKAEYEAATSQMAGGITALVPGLRWYFEENSWNGCGGQYVRTHGRQVYQLVVFSGPIPDDKWPQALQIIKDGAAHFGATDFGVFNDRPGFHDIYLAGPGGVEFRLGTHVASTLSAKSDCRISENYTPTPTHHP